MPGKWIDISVTVQDGMVRWPDNPPVKVWRTKQMSDGAVCNVTAMSLSAHTGTHMDGPLHFIAEGAGLDTLSLDAVLGPCKVIECKDPVSIKPKHLVGKGIRRGDRLLIKTRNSRDCWKTQEFQKDFVYISKEAAQWMVDRGIRTIGVDYLSVGGFYKDGVETHRVLLGAKVWIIEGLLLQKISPGNYDLACLPLKILNSDGAPARAALRRR